MSGEELMERIICSEQAAGQIPLGLQAGLPLPGRRGAGTAECWYYRMQFTPAGMTVYSPAFRAVWDVRTMDILELSRMDSRPLGGAQDVLSGEHRRRENAYLEQLDAACPACSEEIVKSWIAAAPEALQPWLEDEMKK